MSTCMPRRPNGFSSTYRSSTRPEWRADAIERCEALRTTLGTARMTGVLLVGAEGAVVGVSEGATTAPAPSGVPPTAPMAASLRKLLSEMLAQRAVVSASQICAYLMREVIRGAIKSDSRGHQREVITERRGERVQKRRHRQVEHAHALWRWRGMGLPSSAVVSAGSHAWPRGGGEWRTVRIDIT